MVWFYDILVDLVEGIVFVVREELEKVEIKNEK